MRNELSNYTTLGIECGETRKIEKDFATIATDYRGNNFSMKCSESKPCYCHERICLVSNTKKCNEGNVFIDGRPFCGDYRGWEKLGKYICQELGFERLVGVKTNGE